MIKAVVLDVDGVVVGPKSDQHPHASKRVSSALSAIQEKIPVSLLSGKTSFVIGETARQIGLTGAHVADSGAVVFDPMKREVISQASLPASVVESVVVHCADNQVLAHLFTPTQYFSYHANGAFSFERIYAELMHVKPAHISSAQEVEDQEVVKINLYAFDDRQKGVINNIAAEVEVGGNAHANPWSINPSIEGVGIRNITAKGVSKYSGLQELLKQHSVAPEHVLGVGDTIHDWDFIEHCGYKGVMGNATDELKGRFNLEDPYQHMGGDVNDDGLLHIFEHFKLV